MMINYIILFVATILLKFLIDPTADQWVQFIIAYTLIGIIIELINFTSESKDENSKE